MRSSRVAGRLWPTVTLLVLNSFAHAQSGGSGPFQQGGDGSVGMEAEHFDQNVISSGQIWSLTTTAGSSGGEAMSAPAGGQPRLEYEIEFNQAGTHQVYVRAFGSSGSSNSMWLGFEADEFLSNVNISPLGSWQWEGPYAITISSTGVHTLGISRRETATQVDKIYISTSSGDLPVGTGVGESPQ